MPYLLALGAALFYGGADFLGGLAARRVSTVVTVAVSQVTGFLVLLVAIPLLPEASPSRADLLWGVAAGLCGGLGVALLYRALAIGTMAIVAPITAVCAVAVPVLIAVALGERPTLLATAGIVLAIVAIVLVSQGQSPDASAAPGSGRPATAAIPIALMSGVLLGLFFFAFAQAGPDAGMWPLLMTRATSMTLFGVAIIVTAQSVRMAPTVLGIIVVNGVVDMLANVFYLIASRSAPLSVVVTLASLYPASTVMLARLFLAERLTGRQTMGVACALVAVLLIVRHS